MKPITFLELDRDNIISSLTDKNNNFSHEEAIAMHKKCLSIIALLDSCKNDKNKTTELLEQNIPHNIEKKYIINFILRAIQNDDTYALAYNYLAQVFNREGFDVFYPIKTISTYELFTLLENENSNPLLQKEKQYKSYVRAVAIYFVLKSEKEDFQIPETKKETENLVREWVNPDTNKPIGKTYFYQMFGTGMNGNKAIKARKGDDLKKLYPLDYEFALTLLDEKIK